MVSAQLLAIAGSLVLLYVLIKGHLYVTRKLWVPKFEEEAEDDPPDADSGDDAGADPSRASDGGDSEDESKSEDESEEEQPTRGWDHVG